MQNEAKSSTKRCVHRVRGARRADFNEVMRQTGRSAHATKAAADRQFKEEDISHDGRREISRRSQERPLNRISPETCDTPQSTPHESFFRIRDHDGCVNDFSDGFSSTSIATRDRRSREAASARIGDAATGIIEEEGALPLARITTYEACDIYMHAPTEITAWAPTSLMHPRDATDDH
ncbi:MAG: hypothetical protein RL141_136 [Candidatus Parcubacteria bacterium]|jgi:hypothetical protein